MNAITIRQLALVEGYKYLGLMEASVLLHDKLKWIWAVIKQNWFFKAKLNAGNTIKVINTWSALFDMLQV